MGDYLEEINTALSTHGEDFYYESLEDVVSDLESERWDYHEQGKKRAAAGLGTTGSVANHPSNCSRELTDENPTSSK